MTTLPRYALVVPTVGRPSLAALLDALAAGGGPAPADVVIVDDRADADGPLDVGTLAASGWPVRAVRSGGRGPAAARNAGWRAAGTEWIVFVDDDVLPAPDWPARLAEDLSGLPADVGGSQGRVRVPLPAGRRPTDAERNTANLADAAWITADMAYRRAALAGVGGFEERFARAYREDADLALRVKDAGYQLARGARRVDHPARPAGFWASVRAQAGNADDVLMRRLHGQGWRRRAEAPRGRLPRHLLTVAAGGVAVSAAAAGRRRTAAVAAAGWALLTAELARARLAAGPPHPDEVARMLATSVAIPFAACWHRARGEWRYRGVSRRRPMSPPAAVLFDRDGTLVRDVPYNGDPARVDPMPGARAALDILRGRSMSVGVVTNQSGIGRGWLRPDEVRAVHARVEEMLGRFDAWAICPHAGGERCACRKPAPGLIYRAASALGVEPRDCVVIGDIGGDVRAAAAAGARGILVPTPRTRWEEVERAPEVARDLVEAAVRALWGGPR